MDGWANVHNKWEFYLNVRRTIVALPLKTLWEMFTIVVRTTRFTHKMQYHSIPTRSFLFAAFERMQQFYFSFVRHSLLWQTCSVCFEHFYFYCIDMSCRVLSYMCTRVFVDAYISTDTVFFHLTFLRDVFLWKFYHFVLWNGYGNTICRGIFSIAIISKSNYEAHGHRIHSVFCLASKSGSLFSANCEIISYWLHIADRWCSSL